MRYGAVHQALQRVAGLEDINTAQAEYESLVDEMWKAQVRVRWDCRLLAAVVLLFAVVVVGGGGGSAGPGAGAGAVCVNTFCLCVRVCLVACLVFWYQVLFFFCCCRRRRPLACIPGGAEETRY